jgi:hypothetical protein
MAINFKSGYKILFVGGLLLGFTSLFLDWYYLQAVNEFGETVMYWVYNAIFDWSTRFSQGATFNQRFEPKNSSMPIAIIATFVVAMLLSAYSALFHDVERDDSFVKVKRFNFITLFLVTLIGFFVVIYPLFFLLPNELYYPFLLYRDYDLGVVFSYSVGPGYVLQAVSFACTFPYALFNHSVINSFEKESASPEKIVSQYIEKARDDLDIDRLIAREEYLVDSENDPKSIPKSEVETIYEEFLTTRGRK